MSDQILLQNQDFAAALRALRDGHQIRRASWRADAPSYRKLDDAEGLSLEAMLADDWVVVSYR